MKCAELVLLLLVTIVPIGDKHGQACPKNGHAVAGYLLRRSAAMKTATAFSNESAAADRARSSGEGWLPFACSLLSHRAKAIDTVFCACLLNSEEERATDISITTPLVTAAAPDAYTKQRPPAQITGGRQIAASEERPVRSSSKDNAQEHHIYTRRHTGMRSLAVRISLGELYKNLLDIEKIPFC